MGPCADICGHKLILFLRARSAYKHFPGKRLRQVEAKPPKTTKSAISSLYPNWLSAKSTLPLSVLGVSSQRFLRALGVPPGVSLPGVAAPGVA